MRAAAPPSRTVSVLRAVAGVGVLGILGHAYAMGIPRQGPSLFDYFGCFTNLTSLLAAVLLSVVGLLGLSGRTTRTPVSDHLARGGARARRHRRMGPLRLPASRARVRVTRRHGRCASGRAARRRCRRVGTQQGAGADEQTSPGRPAVAADESRGHAPVPTAVEHCGLTAESPLVHAVQRFDVHPGFPSL